MSYPIALNFGLNSFKRYFQTGFRRLSSDAFRPFPKIAPLKLKVDKRFSQFFKKLYKFIAPKLSTRQYGFLKGQSNITQLLLFLTEAYYANEKNNELYAFYLDFAKAFDTVPHHLILTSLRNSDTLELEVICSNLSTATWSDENNLLK